MSIRLHPVHPPPRLSMSRQTPPHKDNLLLLDVTTRRTYQTRSAAVAKGTPCSIHLAIETHPTIMSRIFPRCDLNLETNGWYIVCIGIRFDHVVPIGEGGSSYPGSLNQAADGVAQAGRLHGRTGVENLRHGKTQACCSVSCDDRSIRVVLGSLREHLGPQVARALGGRL